MVGLTGAAGDVPGDLGDVPGDLGTVPGDLGTVPGEDGATSSGDEGPPISFDDIGGWPAVLGRLLAGDELRPDEAEVVLGQILIGAATSAQIAAFVIALRAKGETVGEMTGLVRAMLRHATPLPVDGELLDTCGTGGDRSASINASTIAALVVAGAGVTVCKHGGRAATSAAGSADVLEALGVVIDLGPTGVARCVAETGMGFCFAPRYHPAMRHAVPVRRELGIPTVFNYLGPLANPARARLQVVGVSDWTMAPKMLGVLAANGARRAMVVHGASGLDELSTTGPSQMLWFDANEAEDGGLPAGAGHPGLPAGAREMGLPAGAHQMGLPVGAREMVVDPTELGLAPATVADLRGGDAAANAAVVRRVLGGERGARRDFVLINAAAGLLVAGKVGDLGAGVAAAAESIDTGSARRVLDQLVEVSRRASEEERPR